LSSAGKKTARVLLAGACDSYVPYVLTFVALAGNPALQSTIEVKVAAAVSAMNNQAHD